MSTIILSITGVVELAIWMLIFKGIAGFYRDSSGDWHVRRAAIVAERKREVRRGPRTF